MADYGALSKFLHKLALDNPIVGEMCFDIELSLNRKLIRPSIDGRHVFVSGLARAGTTVLMRALHETDEFASLTYRDMPFVMAPNLWAKIAGQSRTEMGKKMRAHGDGILVDFDSPEALEEIFWKTYVGQSYIGKDGLLPHVVERDVLEKFRDYVSLVLLRYEKSRYLSKNNNNLLRLDSILEAFPNAIILVPFRDPLQQAYSLMKQHLRFQAESKREPFTEKYMGWLVHHEFGSDHRPFKWKHRDAGDYDIDSLDYWLSQWVAAYTALLGNLEKQSSQSSHVIPVCYESLCANAEKVWANLSAELGLTLRGTPVFDCRIAETPRSTDLKLIKEAQELYERLRDYFFLRIASKN